MPTQGDKEAQELAGETRIAKTSNSVAGAIGLAGAALLAFNDRLDQLDDLTKVSFFGLLAVALIVIAIITAADMRTRTQVKIAQLSSASTAASPSAHGRSALAASSPMAVRVNGDSGRFSVLAVSDDGDGRTRYLVGRSGQRPKWVDNSEVEETYYPTDPNTFGDT